MKAREKRSACIFVSSIASIQPFAGMVTYCATKTFVNFMGIGLKYECKNKIDVMSWQPGEITTKMLAGFQPDKKDTSFGCINA
jgi:short-subunit dehydrogenase